MNWVKGFALATCLATPLSVIVATSSMADPAAPAPPSAPAPADASASKATAPDKTKMAPAKSTMSSADKDAKSLECSKEADKKGLHGDARKKFRSSCKRGK